MCRVGDNIVVNSLSQVLLIVNYLILIFFEQFIDYEYAKNIYLRGI